MIIMVTMKSWTISSPREWKIKSLNTNNLGEFIPEKKLQQGIMISHDHDWCMTQNLFGQISIKYPFSTTQILMIPDKSALQLSCSVYFQGKKSCSYSDFLLCVYQCLVWDQTHWWMNMFTGLLQHSILFLLFKTA